MPPAEVTRTAEAVRSALTERLAATRLGHGAVRVHATPRRVVAVVERVQPREEDHEQTARGPRVSAAFDAAGEPTKAVLGFARSQGVDVAGLGRVEEAGTAYVATTRRLDGRPAAEVLAGLLAELVGALRAEKNMRWNAPGLAFSRPIRWLLALLGEQVLPVAVATLAAGRTTRVHRTAQQPTVEVASAEGYLELLAGHGVLADAGERRRLVVDGAVALASEVGAVVDLVAQDSLIDEITNLVERPTPILGRFDPAYLDLPVEILVTVMRKHQRYLPVQDTEGRLLPYFVAVANGDCDHDLVRAGNEAVLRARYEDAAFFWRADLQAAPAVLKEKLALLTFEERLGSMADRAQRIGAIARQFADGVALGADERRALDRAAELAKFDLGSQMVTELSSLAGVMAAEYAARAGEEPAVAQALFETELPRFAEDRLPAGRPGALLALADRFDLLAGLFAIGAAPTGGSDPFGLRRSALGIVNILRAFPELAAVTVEHGLAVAAAQQPLAPEPAVLAEALQFVLRRFEQQLLEAGHAVADVRAVLPLGGAPVRAEQALAELEALSGDERFAALVTAVQRVRRIVPSGTEPATDPALFDSPAEQALHEAVERTAARLGAGAGPARFSAQSPALVGCVNRFFDDVLVMAEDPATRANRLGLLATVAALAAPVLAWQEIRTA